MGGQPAAKPAPPDTPAALARWLGRIEQRLEARLPPLSAEPQGLHGAMRHTVLAPGKRMRPLLTVLIAEALGAGGEALEGAVDLGCAAELVHAASLILDDLPCMDDAPLRRGRPAAHVAFGESTAILAATALLNLSFRVAGTAGALPPPVQIDAILHLSAIVGSQGLIGGQMADLANTGQLSGEEIAALNHRKTGALFDFCAQSGGRVAGADTDALAALSRFARALGQGFQLVDDLLDDAAAAGAADTGKTAGRDAGKATLVTAHGRDAALERARALEAEARGALEAAGAGSDALDGALALQFGALEAALAGG